MTLVPVLTVRQLVQYCGRSLVLELVLNYKCWLGEAYLEDYCLVRLTGLMVYFLIRTARKRLADEGQ